MESMINGLIQEKMMSEGIFEQPPDSDEEEVENFSNEIYQEVMYENLDKFKATFDDKLMFVGNTLALRLNTPNVMICDRCKRELAYKALTEGRFKKRPDVLKYLYATESMRMQPLGIKEKETKEEESIVVVRHGSWYELPDGQRVRKKDLPENVIIKNANEDKNK